MKFSSTYLPTKFSSTELLPADCPPTTAICGKSNCICTPRDVNASCSLLTIGIKLSMATYCDGDAVKGNGDGDCDDSATKKTTIGRVLALPTAGQLFQSRSTNAKRFSILVIFSSLLLPLLLLLMLRCLTVNCCAEKNETRTRRLSSKDDNDDDDDGDAYATASGSARCCSMFAARRLLCSYWLAAAFDTFLVIKLM